MEHQNAADAIHASLATVPQAEKSIANDASITRIPTSSPSAPETKGPTLCGVCNKLPAKYKCPRCYLPHCSVACNKTHQENHPPDVEPKPTTIRSDIRQTSNAVAPVPKPDPSNPFHALDTSEKLQLLFRRYPRLSEQLSEIYAATQPPLEAADKRLPASLMHGINKKDGWNHDVGIRNGKEALRKARRADGEAGDAVREYSELILHLINGQDTNGQLSSFIQQQSAQEDGRLIEQLMEREKH